MSPAALSHDRSNRPLIATAQRGGLSMPEPFFPITKCRICGADVRRMDDRLYRLDIPGALHGCTAPRDGLPEAQGQPLTLEASDCKPGQGIIATLRPPDAA